jgi:hypothetical protein
MGNIDQEMKNELARLNAEKKATEPRKPRVVIAVLTGHERGSWINPQLALNLITAAKDPRFDVHVEMLMDKSPVAFARNFGVAVARKEKADWLLFVDNDQNFHYGGNPLNILAAAGPDKKIIGIATFQGGWPSHPNFHVLADPAQREVDREYWSVRVVGTGAMFISSDIWTKVQPRGPWFGWVVDENSELAETKLDGSEDFSFCNQMRARGIKIWAHTRLIPHLKTLDVTELGARQAALEQAIKNQPANLAPQGGGFFKGLTA